MNTLPSGVSRSETLSPPFEDNKGENSLKGENTSSSSFECAVGERPLLSVSDIPLLPAFGEEFN